MTAVFRSGEFGGHRPPLQGRSALLATSRADSGSFATRSCDGRRTTALSLHRFSGTKEQTLAVLKEKFGKGDSTRRDGHRVQDVGLFLSQPMGKSDDFIDDGQGLAQVIPKFQGGFEFVLVVERTGTSLVRTDVVNVRIGQKLADVLHTFGKRDNVKGRLI